MQVLTQAQTQLVTGGDGYFKLIIVTHPTPECAEFVINVYEKYIMGEISIDEAATAIYMSHFSTEDIETAMQGLQIVYYQ